MEDSKIDAIAREVLTSLKKGRAENTAARATPAPASSAAVSATISEPKPSMHPSLHLLSVVGGVVGSPCIIEPDKACVGSLKCRTFGH